MGVGRIGECRYNPPPMISVDDDIRWSPHFESARRGAFGAALVALVILTGCGTTKWSDTPRTATEQLLISDAIDRAISQIDFGPLKGEKIFLDTQYLNTTIDKDYLISTLRQHMLA